MKIRALLLDAKGRLKEEKADRIHTHTHVCVVAQKSRKGSNFQLHCLLSLFSISNNQNKETDEYKIFF